ncbi:protein RRNAD1 [Nasonia vitripennis]|uniref:Methyltransferase domain-containing protein n=1 Tax=Nasonia vitripennis TaxID=7425 RepID=A0A7M7G544_NASVI|nr:protein RRNAD1 [Nasonia vitripennis]
MAELGNTRAHCQCSICSGIRGTVEQIFRALKIYGWMLDAYVVDFFEDDLWQKLPSVWRSFLDQLSPDELGRWILGESENKKVWPLSLLALRRFIQVAEIGRDHRKPSTTLKCSASTCRIVEENREENPAKKQKLEEKKPTITAKDGQFDNLFGKHVKQKKRYEINVMSEIAANSAKKANCNCIVDIGSGMGHLARVLAYRHELSVTCVEQNRSLLDGARKWDEQLSASLAKHLPDFRERKPRHVSLLVEASSEARRQLADQLTRVFGEDEDNNDTGFGIVGLHPCGDLAASLLRLYANEESARFICIVGCCYMKLTLSETGAEIGYPMSRHLRAMNENCRLSYAALEVACHAVEKHCDKLKTNNYSDLIVHAYRAVLECLLLEKNPSLRHTQLKNTKLKDGTSFEEYCKAATENLEIKDRPTDADFDREEVKSRLQQWKRVLTFGSLRLLLASLVETLVLFDRFLYLSELNLSPSLKSEFDARVSPRNILLVSVKERTAAREYKVER